MKHLTKPADWTDTEWADYRACEDEYQDLQGQVKAREHAYEGGHITREEYDNWEYDYSPLNSTDTDEPSAAAPSDAGPAESLPAEVVQAYRLTNWPLHYSLRVSSCDDGTWLAFGHAEERRVLAAVIAAARADRVLHQLREDGGLPSLMAGITRRWVNNPSVDDDGLRWSYCPPDAEDAVAVTEVEPISLRTPPATLTDLFAARDLDAAAQAVHTCLVDDARRFGGNAAWLDGYSEGAEHMLESMRIPGSRAERFLALLPHAELRPLTITLCGSPRLYRQMLAVAAELTDTGAVVLAPFPPADQSTEFDARRIALQRRRIDMSHRVVVVTDGSGHIDDSTRAEVGYATNAGKPVEWVTRTLTDQSA